MSAVITSPKEGARARESARGRHPLPSPLPTESTQIAIALIGTGLVGSAVLRRLAETSLPIRVVGVANSRRSLIAQDGLAPTGLIDRLGRDGDVSNVEALTESLLHEQGVTRVLIDATPSEAIAVRHADWLARGVHVVSANKIAQGTTLARWQALRATAHAGGTRYGDAATVGAGLPALTTLRRLRRCGDAVRRIEGVFSGSLSFLFNELDGTRPFSRLLAEAFERGYTEPDPRADLSGADVARKLLILARAAGFALEPQDIEVESLVPADLAGLSAAEFSQRLSELDAQIEARRSEALAQGKVLRHLATFEANGRASVALRAVEPSHPAAQLAGADNLFAFTTQRYHAQPLVIRGPGAGAEVTAQALLADVLEIAAA